MAFAFRHQVLVGTVLAGSSLTRPPHGANYYLSMRGQNDKWLRYKMEEMPEYFSASKLHKYGKTYRCNSSCLPELTEWHGVLYRDGRRHASMEILDQLMDIGLAIWYLDSGGKTGRGKKNAYLNVTKFCEDGAQTIERYFNEVGMPCRVNRDGERIKLLFTVPGTQTLFKTIGHRFPEFMVPDE